MTPDLAFVEHVGVAYRRLARSLQVVAELGTQLRCPDPVVAPVDHCASTPTVAIVVFGRTVAAVERHVVTVHNAAAAVVAHIAVVVGIADARAHRQRVAELLVDAEAQARGGEVGAVIAGTDLALAEVHRTAGPRRDIARQAAVLRCRAGRGAGQAGVGLH
jgi:hypothetical protein